MASSSDDEPRVVAIGQGRQDTVPGVALEWLADASLMPGSEMTFGRAQYEPGASNPSHYHPNCHELLFVVEGQLEHTVGSRSISLSTGSLLHIPKGVAHHLQNTGNDRATLVVVFSTDARETIWVNEKSA